MNDALNKASQLAGKVYERFMAEVVEAHVLTERAGRSLGEKEKAAIAQKKQLDTRVIYLMSLSGKGGFNSDKELNERYSKNHNVTLLDHLLSVTRGALMLAALDYLQQNPEMDSALLIKRLRVLAAIAFLHDLDKMLQLPRNQELTVQHVEAAMSRYGIREFLGDDIDLSADQIRFLIEHAEDSQKHRNPPAIEPARDYKNAVERYVKLADKLDGIWHEKGAESGLESLIERLQKDQSLVSPILEQWQPLEIFDPHHPFLMDELQRSLSFASVRKSGIPPLLETHQDGRLFMLLPTEQFNEIKQFGLNRLSRVLPFNLEVNISNRGIPELLNGQPDQEELIKFLEDLDRKDLGRLFQISNLWIEQITPHMDERLQAIDLQPRWPKLSGQMSTPYPDPASYSERAQQKLLEAAHLALLFSLKLPITKKTGLPDYEQRESAILSLLESPLPDWLSEMEDARSRRLLISLWVTALAHENTALQAAIWGEEGLLKRWLEGSDEQQGFNQFFAGEGVEITQAVRNHFEQLLGKKRVTPINESATGRCLFTDAPTATIMSGSLNLYEVKVSAFSGRDGKPDSVSAPSKGVVPIGLVSLAEHKLRKSVYEVQGGKPSGVPSLVSSPITTGLFGALILNDEKNFQALSSYDLARKVVEKGKVNYRGLELYRQRYRMARLERIPDKTDTQINTLRLLLQSCQRIGRPIHVFRGLPTPQKAFFYFDAMPTLLKNLVGGNALRIEQIPGAIEHLSMAQTIADTSGLGYDLLSLFATPSTRFKATALIWCFARDVQRDNNSAQKTASMRSLQFQILQLQQETIMSNQDGALVRLGESAMSIQRIPLAQSSTSEEMLVFNFCLDSALQLRGLNITDDASLIAGIAGELETNLVRKEKMSASKYRNGAALEQACMDYATQFVTDVWKGVLGGKPPAQKSRRLLGSIYRMAFLQACRRQSEQNKAEKAQASATTTTESN